MSRNSTLAFVAALMGLATLTPACSKSAPYYLIVDVSLDPNLPAPDSVTLIASQLVNTLKQTTLSWSLANAGHLEVGFPLPGDTTIPVVVTGVAYRNGESSNEGFGQTKPYSITKGRNNGPIQLVIEPTTRTESDGGVPDAQGDATGGEEVPGDDVLAADGGFTSDAERDGQGTANTPDAAAGSDAPVDVALPLDGRASPDGVTSPVDVPADAPATDMAGTDDAGMDAAEPDAMPDAGPTPMAVLSRCTPYQHTLNQSNGKPLDWAVRSLSFSTDGKLLVSASEDGRVKLWNVAGATLQDSNIVFTGDRNMSAAISPDGKYLATGDESNVVRLYDLLASLGGGSASPFSTLAPTTPFSPAPFAVSRVQFTDDNNYVIAVYQGDMAPDLNRFLVWDRRTQLAVRSVNYAYDDWPMATLHGTYAEPMWVVSAATSDVDGGGSASTVTLLDVAAATPSKGQFTVPGEVNKIAFSPDATTLAIGTLEGEVGLWDITNKSNVTRSGSALVAPSSSSINALAFTADGQYLAVAIGDAWGQSTVSVVSLQTRQSVTKALDWLPVSVAFSPDGLGLAVGEEDDGVFLYCRN
jgi:WD domain, G-beta repeat